MPSPQTRLVENLARGWIVRKASISPPPTTYHLPPTTYHHHRPPSPTTIMRTSILLLAAASATAPAQSVSHDQWSGYGHDALGARFSPLTQITRDNVQQLAVAWTYRTGEVAAHLDDYQVRFEATPLFVDGTLYFATPHGRVIALDPAT